MNKVANLRVIQAPPIFFFVSCVVLFNLFLVEICYLIIFLLVIKINETLEIAAFLERLRI